MSNPFTAIATAFEDVGKGVLWVGKEIGKGFSSIPKLITLTDDAKQIASDAVPKVLDVLDAGKDLANSTAQDGSLFLLDVTALGGAIVAAAGKSGADLVADSAVLAAVEKLVSDFKADNVKDILASWQKILAAVHALNATVESDLKKLESDATA